MVKTVQYEERGLDQLGKDWMTQDLVLVNITHCKVPK